MAENKKSFLMYCEWKEIFNGLSDKDCVELIRHIFSYVNDETPISNNPIVNAVFIPIKQQLKRDLKKYENIIQRNKINGKKGGRPKKKEAQKNPKNPVGYLETQITQANPDKPKKADNDISISIDINIYKEKLMLFKHQISNNEHEMWRESLYRNLTLKKGALFDLTDVFINHLVITNTRHENIREFKKHFYNWLNGKSARGDLATHQINQRKKDAL